MVVGGGFQISGTPALWRLGQEDYPKFKASLSPTTNSRPVGYTFVSEIHAPPKKFKSHYITKDSLKEEKA